MAKKARRRRFWRRDEAAGPFVVGLECGGDHLSVALVRLPEDAGQPVAKWSLLDEVTSFRGHAHADAILVVLARMLERHELAPSQLSLVGVGRGPGGFTGVRVGMATALGLTLGSDAAPWPVDSLLALARNALGPPSAEPLYVTPMLDARKNQVYAATYRVVGGRFEAVVEPTVTAHQDALQAAQSAARDAPLLVFGSGAIAYECASAVPTGWHRPSALHVAQLAAKAWEAAGRPASGESLDPVYIRPSDAELKAKKIAG